MPLRHRVRLDLIGVSCTAEVRVVWPDSDLTEELYFLDGDARFDLVQGEAAAVWP